MFKKTATYTTLFLMIATIGWLVKLMYITDADLDRYEALKNAGKAIAAKEQEKKSYQYRSGVRKDLWLAQEDHTRLHHRIASQSSRLTLVPIDDKVDIIEHLQNLQCWMQDKIFLPTATQQLRYFEAEQGIYQYSIQRFAASSVILSLFRLQGTDLPFSLNPKTAFLQGIAQDVSFSIAGKATQFQAKQFKATLTSQQEKKP